MPYIAGKSPSQICAKGWENFACQLERELEHQDAEKNRLVREMDEILNGSEGMAQQASLCDMVSQVRGLKECLMRWKGMTLKFCALVLLTVGDHRKSCDCLICRTLAEYDSLSK